MPYNNTWFSSIWPNVLVSSSVSHPYPPFKPSWLWMFRAWNALGNLAEIYFKVQPQCHLLYGVASITMTEFIILFYVLLGAPVALFTWRYESHVFPCVTSPWASEFLKDKDGDLFGIVFSHRVWHMVDRQEQRRRWHPTPVLLPGKSHGWRSLVGCSPWGREELDTTKRLHFHFSLSCIGEGNGNPLQCSCLENPKDGGDWWAESMGSHRVGHDWSDLAAAADRQEIFLV